MGDKGHTGTPLDRGVQYHRGSEGHQELSDFVRLQRDKERAEGSSPEQGNSRRKLRTCGGGERGQREK